MNTYCTMAIEVLAITVGVMLVMTTAGTAASILVGGGCVLAWWCGYLREARR